MNQDLQSTEIISSLSEEAQACLRDLGIVFDVQLKAAALDELGVPPTDLMRIRAVVARLRDAPAPPDLKPLCGVPIDEEGHLDGKDKMSPDADSEGVPQ